MKSICIDSRMLHSAGIGTYLKELISNLKNLDFKIFLIVTSKLLKEEKELLKDFEIIILNANIYSIKEQLLLPFKIPKCDLFFSPHFNIPIFWIRAKKRVVTIHDVYHLAFFSKLSFFEKIYAKFVIGKAIKLSDKIITVSNFSKDEILKYTKAERSNICVIYNGINFNFFREIDDLNLIKNIKEKYDLPSNYFLFVGNLKPHKNLLNLIKAFEDFVKENPTYYLVVVGKNNNLKNSFDIHKAIENNENLQSKIKIIGNATNQELLILYQLAKALVFPSYYEGFGYPPLEAMAMSCPVIASNTASIPEICKDGAVYIDPYEYKTIFLAMQNITKDENLKKELIIKGKETVKSYTTLNFVKKHFELFENL
jgi:glycosyltransferase involved in cell wall biosynthesis